MHGRLAARAARSWRPTAEKSPWAAMAPILPGPWFGIPLSPVCQGALRPGQVTDAGRRCCRQEERGHHGISSPFPSDTSGGSKSAAVNPQARQMLFMAFSPLPSQRILSH
jgi:hypothetical protein